MSGSSRTPSYRHHKSSGLAVVTLDGVDIYLGKFRTPASRREYDRVVSEYLAAGRRLDRREPVLVSVLAGRFLDWAAVRYVKSGRPTSEYGNYVTMCGLLVSLYGDISVDRFGPRQLSACRRKMADRGWRRRSINRQLYRIRRVFKWAVARQIIDVSLWQALCAVEGYRIGELPGAESPAIAPVREAALSAVRGEFPPVLWSMVQVQRLSGCRPGELVLLRPEFIDHSGPVWAYLPPTHKTEHHGHRRMIFFGPRAQAHLEPLLSATADGQYVFRPSAAWDWWLARRRESRKVPLSCGNRPGRSNRPRRRARRICERFTVDTYRQAIRRACDRAGEDRFTPHQLRHSAATEITAAAGIEAARVVLGHKTLAVTDIYAEKDFRKAASIAQRLG